MFTLDKLFACGLGTASFMVLLRVKKCIVSIIRFTIPCVRTLSKRSCFGQVLLAMKPFSMGDYHVTSSWHVGGRKQRISVRLFPSSASCYMSRYCYILFHQSVLFSLIYIPVDIFTISTNMAAMTFRKRTNSPLSHGGHIVPGDQKSFVLPR